MQDFCPRINMLKGNCFKTILQCIMIRQKVPKLYFQSQFSMSKINRIFSKKNSFKNINLGDHFLAKTFFSRLNSLTTLLFDGFLNRIMLILGQKSYFIGPTIFENPCTTELILINLCKTYLTLQLI